jgi:hypothetical protein
LRFAVALGFVNDAHAAATKLPHKREPSNRRKQFGRELARPLTRRQNNRRLFFLRRGRCGTGFRRQGNGLRRALANAGSVAILIGRYGHAKSRMEIPAGDVEISIEMKRSLAGFARERREAAFKTSRNH